MRRIGASVDMIEPNVRGQADPDTYLMSRLCEGDLAAFDNLVERHRQRTVRVISRTLGDAVAAEDLAQDAFVRVFIAAPTFRFSATFSTWFHAIVRNLCLNELRRRSRRWTLSLDANPTDGDETEWQYEDSRQKTPPQIIVQEELEDTIAAALRELPRSQRIAVQLCAEEELSYEEIARTLGTSLSATKSVIHRGRRTVRARIARYLRA